MSVFWISNIKKVYTCSSECLIQTLVFMIFLTEGDGGRLKMRAYLEIYVLRVLYVKMGKKVQN